MAETVATPPTVERVTATLDYACREWLRVPEYVRDWPKWDEDQRLVFVLEWPKREDALEELDSWHMRGALPEPLQTRYSSLKRVVDSNRPLVEPLLVDESR